MKTTMQTWIALGVATVAAFPSPAAWAAQDAPTSGAARPGPTWAEFIQLQNEVREQRQLLIQLIQTEQQRYDMLLKLMQGAGAATPAAVPAAAAASDGAETRGRTLATTAPRASEPSERSTGTVEGKVIVPGGDTKDLYVYVENFRGPAARGKTLEIRQEDKKFIPQVAVVPAGTTVTFPNVDPIFHNVFSNSPRNSFDLGSYRAGDRARSAVFSAPGVVDIFCNMHQRMSAHVLVVPSRLYARVNADGTFRLDGIPPGPRTIVAWSPSLKPAQQKVDVTPGGAARTSFQMEYTDQKSHTNKFGQPYGSYKE